VLFHEGVILTGAAFQAKREPALSEVEGDLAQTARAFSLLEELVELGVS
jgi:hypothetical protein